MTPEEIKKAKAKLDKHIVKLGAGSNLGEGRLIDLAVLREIVDEAENKFTAQELINEVLKDLPTENNNT